MIGETLVHYTITDKLGEGGMGEVYRAHDGKLGRDVAIKVLPEAVGADPERLARFEREARVLAALDHPNIASIYGLEEAEGRQLLVMQLAEGETLAQRLERGRIPVEEALPIAQQIAEALEAAHDKGIIHRDLKPANVVVDPQGQAKVLDFGLAKALDPKTVSGSAQDLDASPLSLSPTLTAQMTTAGVLLGTAAYMSPEQARGQEAGRRSDLWAFGAVFYEMLTAHRLFGGSTVSDTLAAVLRSEPDWSRLPDETPTAVRRLLRRCLEREARYRLSDASSAWLEIQDARAGRDEAGPGEHETEETPVWKKALPWVVAGLASAALLVALIVPFRSQTVTEESGPVMRLGVSISENGPDLDLGSNYMLSPDGSHLAYVVIDHDENFQLHVRSLDQLGSTQLVASSGAESPYHPFFSPDGEWIGYVTTTELKKIPVAGGAPVALTNVNRSRGAWWAPDDTVIFTPDPESPLMRVSASGGQPEAITTLDEEKQETSHRWPQSLPGGTHVLFTSGTEEMDNYNEATIEVVELGSGERKVIHQGGFFGRYAPGGYLLFINENTLFARPFDLARLEATGPPVPVAHDVSQDVGEGGAQFDIASTGTLIYVSGQDQFEEYQILRSDRQGDIDALWDDVGTYSGLRYSPSGSKLALARLKDDNMDLWVHDLERGTGTRLTFDPAGDILPVWSPDEQYIAFASSRQGPPQLYRKRADGSGEPELIVEVEKFLAPNSWSTDGRFLAGVTLGQSFDLWVYDLEGEGEVEEYLSTPFIEWYPSFSPDGRWIAYMSDESGRYEVYVRPYPQAGGRWQISVDGGGQPKWSIDGGQLYYRTDTGLMVVDVDARGDSLSVGKPRNLFDGPFRGGVTGLSSSGIMPDWDVTADGQTFVFFEESNQQGRGTLVTMVTNFDAELQRLVAKDPE